MLTVPKVIIKVSCCVPAEEEGEAAAEAPALVLVNVRLRVCVLCPGPPAEKRN